MLGQKDQKFFEAVFLLFRIISRQWIFDRLDEMSRRPAWKLYGRTLLNCFSCLVACQNINLCNNYEVHFKFHHDLKSILNFKILKFRCSDTKANRRKPAPKIGRWIPKFRNFDWFAKENFRHLDIFSDHSGPQSQLLFACPLLRLRLLCW